MADAHANFAYATVAVAPSPSTSGTSLTLATGTGTLMPTAPFNMTVWPVGVAPIATNAEILRVTARSGDVLTITRAQEGTSARAIVVGDQICASITAKTLTDAEAAGSLNGSAYNSAVQALANAAFSTIVLNAEDFQVGSMHSTTVNNSRITAPVAGQYFFVGRVLFTSNPTGNRYLLFMVNGALLSQIAFAANPLSASQLEISKLFHLEVNDYVELVAFQDSGGSLNSGSASTRALANELTWFRVS